jgi:dolichol-phosphate mannosyltransferase
MATSISNSTFTTTRRDGGEQVELSIVSPVYAAQESIAELVARCSEAAGDLTPNYEIVLVDDRSPDNSWSRIVRCCTEDDRVKGVRLTRNVGQHRAITAGLAASRGNYVIVLDCDLQDDPKYFKQLYETIQQGYDVVYTRKRKRQHSGLRNVAARIFYRMFNWLVEQPDTRAPVETGAYSILTRRVVEGFLQVKDYHRHYLMVLRWLGFPSTSIEIEHVDRPHGRSSYTLRKLIVHAIDGIASQSQRLLYASITVGLSFVVVAMCALFWVVIQYFIIGARPGWTSTTALILLTSGIVLLSLGIHGIYIGRIFDEVRQRPLFLVDTALNLTSGQRQALGESNGLPVLQGNHGRERRQ